MSTNYESIPLPEVVPRQIAPSTSSFSLFTLLKMNDMDINMKSAVIHVISDLISSLGVLTASILLSINPEWTFVDPICTFFFSIMVFASTWPLMKRCVLILMEAVPQTHHIDLLEIRVSLVTRIPYIQSIETLYAWSLSQDTHICMVALVINVDDFDRVQGKGLEEGKERYDDEEEVDDVYTNTVRIVTKILKDDFDFDFVNVQVTSKK
ncbi:UNVERIFIED_CONTAM: hypothetical protein HDU68_012612 [Siphonaria sp. JEL0065]|nr:hypothetical protein HDU68_012612 [Siphonaria sp. JEL0065]